MIKISTALRELINDNPSLTFGLYHRLLNLTRLAGFLQPLVESRTKKQIKTGALLMGLSRLQKQVSKTSPVLRKYRLDNITVYSSLNTYTFHKNSETHAQINRLYSVVSKSNGYITITEGTNEITLIIDHEHRPLLEKSVSARPKYSKKNLSALGIKFSPEYTEVPGLIYFLVEQLNLQGINIAEISSTYTELILYIDEKDTKLAFETLFTYLQTAKKLTKTPNKA